ncbi:MAG: ChbG/HpnK family deacetylase [Lachnospiraceae bacterium]|nr:ChbG/HpnK family deacetylase [Lachnospiraceae bacterium]
MKVIFRADDVGYTPVSNRGAFRSMEEGVVSLVELMVDCPGSEEAMEFLKERPWISVNWHTHWWGTPVAGAENVPSLVDASGHFRKDLGNSHRFGISGIDYEDMLRECRAEVEFYLRKMGRVPDATNVGNSIIGRAKKAVCDEYGIVYGYNRYYHYGPEAAGHKPGMNLPEDWDPKYEEKRIFEYENFGRPGLLLKDYKQYDPLEMIMTMPEGDYVWMRSEHPGYVDERIWEDTAEICSIQRCKDVEALCSPELKAWIRENHVELVNLRDALYGSREYQNYLLATGSDLALERLL